MSTTPPIASSLWETLPPTSRELIAELNLLVPPAYVAGPIQPDDVQRLVFAAGRRDLVEQLLRVLERQSHVQS